MSEPQLIPGDRVITTDNAYFIETRETQVQVASDEWEKDWEDYRVGAKSGLKGTVVRSTAYETTVQLDGGESRQFQTVGLQKLTVLDQIVESLDDDSPLAVL